MTGGGLLQLHAQSHHHHILFGNPCKTFFKSKYSKTTNFAIQKFKINFNGEKKLRHDTESVFEFTIPRYGDLLYNTFLVLTLPHIWSTTYTDPDTSQEIPYKFRWIKNIGSHIISNIEYSCGGHVIQSCSGEYLFNLVQRDFNYTKKELYNTLTGNISKLNNPEQQYNGNYPTVDKNSTQTPEPSIRSKKLYIPINAWFTLSEKMAFPLVSMQYAELKITVTLRPISELYTIYIKNPKPVSGEPIEYGNYAPVSNCKKDEFTLFVNPPSSNTSILKSQWDTNIHLLSEYIFLSKEERKHFASKPQRYLITQSKTTTFYNIFGPKRIDLESSGLIKNFTWFLRKSNVNLTNNWGLYTNNNDPLTLISSSQSEDSEELQEIESQVNQEESQNIELQQNSDNIPTTTTVPQNSFNIFSNINNNRLYTDDELFSLNISNNIKNIKLNKNLFRSNIFRSHQNQNISVDHQNDNSYNINNHTISTSNVSSSSSSTPTIYYTPPAQPSNETSILKSFALILSGAYREVELDADIYEYVEKYNKSESLGYPGQYTYNFSLRSDIFTHQPSGGINMSKFTSIQFELDVIEPPLNPVFGSYTFCDTDGNVIGSAKTGTDLYLYTYELVVIEESYNILEISNGLAGLVFMKN